MDETHFRGLPERIEAAEQRISSHVFGTPLDASRALSNLSSAKVYCKLENLQYTGSFKVRGAFNKILSLSHAARDRGVVAASTGNHGTAVAYALSKLGLRGIVFVPEGSSPAKVANIRRYGTEVREAGAHSGETETFARGFALERGLEYISPYNDWDVIAGAGTIGIEIANALPSVDVVIAALGGGGLCSGIAAYLKARKPALRTVAASPSNSKEMIESLRAGKIVHVSHLPTISDATAGGIEGGAITFELCRELIDECIEVSEAEISAAMRLFIESHHMLLEGAAGVAIAALLRNRSSFAGTEVVVVISGANIAADALKAAL